jgi:DNA replicative helicase MCM subunit Mcm2 (Cdc46/Mcm family)
MCVLKDEVDASVDSDLATFIINSHIKSHPNVEEDEILPALLDDPKAA